MGDDAFDSIMRSLDAPMVVVTTATDHERAGCLIGFHSQCSIEPVRYAVWLSKANHTCRVGLHATHFALHYLREGDRAVAEVFGELTGDDVDKFERVATSDGPHGVPLLDDVADRIVFRRTSFLEEGSDHICFMLEPVDASMGSDGSSRPMRLSDVDDLTPGHEAVERPDPTEERASTTGTGVGQADTPG